MVSGDQQPFEEPDSYLQRRKRDRFTRPMRIRYLAALGIEADDVTVYRQAGTLFESLSDYIPRTMTLAEARAAYTRG